MLIELLATLIIGFKNPADTTGKTMYPSGLHDCDKDFLAAPASEFPALKISVSLVDKYGTVINPGIYQAGLRNKEISLIQEGQIVGVLPVIVTRALSQNCIISEAILIQIDSDYVQVSLKQNLIEAQSIIRIAR